MPTQAIDSLRRWADARRAINRAATTGASPSALMALSDAEHDAVIGLADAVPESMDDLVAQLTWALVDLLPAIRGSFGRDDIEARLLTNMLVGAALMGRGHRENPRATDAA